MPKLDSHSKNDFITAKEGDALRIYKSITQVLFQQIKSPHFHLLLPEMAIFAPPTRKKGAKIKQKGKRFKLRREGEN